MNADEEVQKVARRLEPAQTRTSSVLIDLVKELAQDAEVQAVAQIMEVQPLTMAHRVIAASLGWSLGHCWAPQAERAKVLEVLAGAFLSKLAEDMRP